MAQSEAHREIQNLTNRIGALCREQRKRGATLDRELLISDLRAKRTEAWQAYEARNTFGTGEIAFQAEAA